MQYLIGEIGFSLLVAGLIGLLVGWLLSRFFKSRSAVRNRKILEKDILRRDREIHLLRDDLDHAYRSSDSGTRGRKDGRGDYAVATKGMQSSAASLTVRRNKDGSQSQISRPIAPPPGYRGPQGGRSDSTGGRDTVSVETKSGAGRDQHRSPNKRPGDSARRPSPPQGRVQDHDQNLKATIDDERHQKITAIASSGEREQQLKKRLEEESFHKIQALAKLGEKDRQIATTTRVSSITAAPQPAMQVASNESSINDYEKLLNQKNSQVDQLQQKVRELLALKKRPAPSVPPVPVDTGASRERERLLKASVEEETFAKVQAIAALGEAEHKLKQAEKRPTVDHEIAPLRRRAEQQDAIILDLRKRIELQQNQSNIMRQEFDRKLKGRDSDLATLKADFSANTSSASQAEVDSYRRKLVEADRANQSRIKDFNATLESRNREYDQLGKRLEDLRQQIQLKDGQLNELKKELDQQRRDRTAMDVKGNKWREELGALQIAVDEKDASLGLLKTRNSELERSGTDVRDMEKQLVEFTASTEASARKFESVILEQRKKLEAYEQEIAALKKLNAERESELQTQLLSLRKTVKDNENKNQALVADTNRFRSAQSAKDAEISQLGKDIKAATLNIDSSQQEIKRLELIAKEAETLKAKSQELEVTQERLKQQLETARSAQTSAAADTKKSLGAKDQEINRLSADLTAARQSIDNEKSEVLRFKKERDAEKSNIVQLTSRFESEAKKQQEKIGSLEPLQLKLRDSESAQQRQRSEHELKLKKSAEELSLFQSKISTLEKSNADQLGVKDKELADLRVKTKELNTLRGDLDQRDGKIATLDKEIEKLRTQKNEYNNEIARLSKEIDDGKAEAAQLRKTLEAEKQSIGVKAKELETVRASVKERDVSLAKIQKEFRATADGDKKALGDLQSKLDSAGKSHQLALSEREKQIGELKHKLQEIDTLRAQNSKYADQIKVLDGKLGEATKSAEAGRQQVTDLKKAADEARIQMAKEKEQLSADLRKAKEYGTQVDGLKKQSETYQSQILGLKTEVKTNADQYHKTVKELEPWQQRFKEADQQARDHQASIVKLKADTSADLEKQLGLARHQNSELLAQRDKRIADLDGKVKMLDGLRRDIEQKDKKLSDLNAEINTARQKAAEYEKRVNAAEEQSKTLEASIGKLKSDQSAAGTQHQSELDNNKKQLHELKSQLQSLEQRRATETKEHTVAFDRVKGQLSDSEKKAADASKKMQEAKSQWDGELAGIRKSHESKMAELDGNHRKALDVQRGKVESGAGELQSLKSRIANLEPLQGKLAAQESENSRLEKVSREATEKSAADLAALRERVKQLEPLQKQLAASEQAHQQLQATLKSTAEKHTAEVAALQGHVNKLEPLQKKLASQEAEYNRLQESRKATAEKTATELGTLQARVQGIEPLERKLSAQEADYRKLQDTYKASSDKSSAEMASLHARIRELEPLQQKLSAREAETKRLQEAQKATVDRTSGEIATLKARIRELEPLQQKLDAQQSEYQKLQTARSAESDKLDAEIIALQQRVRDYDSVQQKLKTQQSEYQSLQSSTKGDAEKGRAEIASLKGRLNEIDVLQRKLTTKEKEYGDLESSRKIAQEKSNTEIAQLKAAIQSAEQEAGQRQSASAQELAAVRKTADDNNSAAMRKLAEANDRIKLLEPLQAELKAEQSEYQSLLGSTKVEGEKARAEIAALQGRLNEIDVLQRKLTTKEKEFTDLGNARKIADDKSNAEIARLKAGIHTAEEEATRHKTASAQELATVRRTAEDNNSAAMRKLAEANDRIKLLEPLQAELKAEQSEYQSLLGSTKVESEKARAEITALQGRLNEIDVLQRKLTLKEKEHSDLEHARKASQDKYSAEIAQLKSGIQSAEAEAGKRQSASAQELAAVRKAADDNNSAAMRKLAEANDRIQLLEPLQKETKDRQSQIDALTARLDSADAKYQKDLNDLRNKLQQAELLRAEVSNRDRALDNANKQLANLQREHDDQKSAAGLLRKEADGKQTEINSLLGKASQLVDVEKKLNQAVQSDSARSTELNALRQELKALQDKAARDNAESERKHRSLSDQLSRAELESRRVSSLETEVKAQKTTVADLNNRLSEQAANARRLTDLEKQLADSKHRYQGDVAERDDRIKSLMLEIEKLKAKPAPKPKAQVTADGKKTTRKDGMDDLKLIFGIGPKIEEMLNGEGVRHFEDIAAWKQTDIDRYAAMLDGFPDRIERDEWVLSAQQIIDGTYNWEERRKAREEASKPKTTRTTVTADGKKTTRKDGMDDLKLIFGIGPAIEKMLNKNNVKHFEDIAGWSEADVSRFSDMLDSFPDRIERDEWVQSAQEIVAGTYNWTERKKARETKG